MKKAVIRSLILTILLTIVCPTLMIGQDYISFLNPIQHPFNLSTKNEVIIRDRGLNFVEFEINISGATTTEVMVGNSLYQYLHLDGFAKMDIVGSPATPVFNTLVAVPFGANARLEIIEQESIIKDGYNIHPALQPARDTYGAEEPAFEINQQVYSSNIFYPLEVVEIADIQKIRGMPIAQLQIRPVQFNPYTSELMLYSTLVCRIVFEGTDASFDKIAIENTKHYSDIIKSAVVNPLSIPDGCPRESSDVGEKDYIIITHSNFDAAADSLARWKRQLGYSVEVVSQSSWTAAQVKTAISSRYTSWTPKPDYFVIIGDHTGSYAVPGEIKQDPNYGDDFSTDLYFACMDGGSDFYPDMAHGRISPSTASEAMVIVQKIINYEKNPVTNASYYSNGLNCAQYQDDDPIDNYADRRFCHTSEEIRDYMQDEQGYTVQRIYYTDSPDPTYFNNGNYSPAGMQIPAEMQLPSFDWNGGSTDITSAINAGKFYVFHRDHGYTGGSGWHRPYYTTTSMNSLTNGNLLPIVFSINCHTGEFQLSNCFAEKLLRLENKGAVGVVAASYYSYSGYNDGFSIGMINTIWPSPGLTPSFGNWASSQAYGTQVNLVTMGDVVNQGLIRMAASWGNNQYTHELFHWFGDPAMKIWTENPNLNAITASYPSLLALGSTSLSISSCSESDAVATLVQDGVLLAKTTLSGGSGTLVFTAVAGSTEPILTISKHNCKPLVDHIALGSCTFPVSDFMADITAAGSLTNISFTDLSGCTPTAWHWNFPGGNPSYSSDQNPSIRYDQPGNYDVVLTTSNAEGSNTMIKNAYISISDTNYTFYLNDDCNISTGWQMTGGTANWQNVDPTTPNDDHTIGGNCFITEGNTQYGTQESYILTSPSIDLSSATSCELSFWMYLSQEGVNYDGGFIELFDGSTWNTVDNAYLDPDYDGTLATGDLNPYAGLPAWYNARPNWTKVTVDLEGAGYDGISNFQLRFKFGADKYSQGNTGWAIDDVVVCRLDIPFCPNYVVWTGMNGNTNWSNAGNWSNNAVPGSATNVHIPQWKPGSFYPETFGSTSIEVNGVTIESNAILRVPLGYSLTINGDLNIEN